jgi:hypothetical protein
VKIESGKWKIENGREGDDLGISVSKETFG